MEQTEILKQKIIVVERALKSFQKLMEVDILPFDDLVKDGLKNGQIQKFEYCSELIWKLIKRYMFYYEGIEINTPKGALKSFYQLKQLSEQQYEILIKMIDDRNRLSHIYRESIFNSIYQSLEAYLKVMLIILEKIKNLAFE